MDVLIKLWDAEQTICTSCQRSVIGICPLRGQEPDNPEKTKCPVIQKLRGLKQYNITQPDNA